MMEEHQGLRPSARLRVQLSDLSEEAEYNYHN